MGVTTHLGQTGRNYQYVPSLRAKSGEVEALRNLDPGVKPRIFPLFQIMSSTSATFATDLAAAWPGLPVALDGAARSAADGSSQAFATLLQSIGLAGVPVLPVLDVGATGPYHTGVGAVLNRYAPGLVLRSSLANLPNAAAWLTQQGGSIADTDLLIDANHVSDFDPPLIAQVAITALQPLIAQPAGWRSMTLVSSSAPQDVGGLVPGPNLVPRRCWQLWQAVAPVIPNLHFGDHGISHRSLFEPPPAAMARATVSPRYALPAEWIIRRGVATNGPNGQPMTAQYHGHAQGFAGHPGFGQVPGCWADARIQQIAAMAGVGRSGNRETWVGLGFNRHASVTCHHLP
ncbi:beta family protein [Methylobacterium sp. D53M]